MRTMLLTAALAFATATSSYAADMALKAPPQPAPVATWTGIYVGVTAGYGGGTDSFLNQTTGIPSGRFDISGGLAGGTYGINWQVSPQWVLGLECDISWSGIKNNVTPSPNPAFGCAVGCAVNLKWLGTDRVRAGYLVTPNYLFYATGGVAYGRVNAGLNPAFPAPGSCCDFENRTRTGWTVGGGVEGKLPIAGWSVKAEYLYVDFGSKTNFNVVIAAPVNPESVSLRQNIFRVGLNYQLGILK
jgi:outer membrane immunogenic protein